MSQYQYTCDECDKRVKTYSPIKCNGCGINLCEGCKSKHKFHLCKWCTEDIPSELMAKRRTAIILMLITPILLLVIPVPKPAFFLLFPYESQNRIQVLLIFGMIALSLIIYPIIIGINKKRMVKYLTTRSKVNSVVSVKKTDENLLDGESSSKIDPYKSLNVYEEKKED
jgi:hypothetical protein